MVDRRAHAFLDPAASEPVHRQQVEAALQRLARLIAANTTADGALENRVIDLEDAPGGYTAENARDDVGAALVAGTGISITVSDVGDTITIANTIAAVTDEHIQDVVGAMVVAGTGISVSYNDAGATETITCTITQYTDEMARDALGTALIAGTGITITPNDGADTITITNTVSATTQEQVEDWVGALVIEGHGIDITYNDGAGTLTVAVDETEIDLTADNIVEGSGVIVLARSATAQAVTNTAAVTDILAYTIPANTLTAARKLRVKMGGTYVNNSGGTRAPVWSIVLPGAGGTIWGDTASANGASALERPWSIEFEIACVSSTLVHMVGAFRWGPTNVPTTGLGFLGSGGGLLIDAAITSATAGTTVSALTSDRLLSVNFNHPTNTATQTLTRTEYSVELLP